MCVVRSHRRAMRPIGRPVLVTCARPFLKQLLLWRFIPCLDTWYSNRGCIERGEATLTNEGAGYSLHQWVCLGERLGESLCRFSEEQHDKGGSSSLSKPVTSIPQYVFKYASSSSVVIVQPCLGDVVRPFVKMRREQSKNAVLFSNFLKEYASIFDCLQ